MRIRRLCWSGIPVWPPEWLFSDHGLAEKGILENVRLRKDLTPGFIGVTAYYLEESRFGIIILEDPAQLQILYQKLKANLGRPLHEIGDLEIDFSPSSAKYGLKQSRPQPPANYPKEVASKK